MLVAIHDVSLFIAGLTLGIFYHAELYTSLSAIGLADVRVGSRLTPSMAIVHAIDRR